MKRFKTGFILPHFRTGGVESVTLRLLEQLDRTRFDPVLILQKKEGALLDQLPSDVDLVDLNGRRASGAVLELHRLVKDRKIDLLYTANNAVSLMALAALRAMPERPRLVISDHTPLSDFLSGAKLKPVRRALISLLYPKADALCAPIEDVLDEYRKLFGARTPPCHRLPNPVLAPLNRPIEPDPRTREQIEALPRPLILSAGRLSFEKGVDRLLEAFVLFARHEPNASLAILGDGPEREALQAQALERGIGGKVHFFGNTPDAQVYFKHADLFALASRREGFGNVLIEALAAQTPIIAFDCPYGPRRILDGGRLGRLVKDGDIAKFAERMRDAVHHPAPDSQHLDALAALSKQYAADEAARAWENMALATLELAKT